jgi:hypothetical protein
VSDVTTEHEDSRFPYAPQIWKPGQSGNPGGRPKGVAALARAHTAEAIETLVRALRSDDERVAVTAAATLLDRGWGKVVAAQTDSDNPVGYVIRGPAPVNSTDEWLKRIPKPADADVHK